MSLLRVATLATLAISATQGRQAVRGWRLERIQEASMGLP